MNWAAAAVVLGMMTASGSAAEEALVLSDLDLDAVTAAGVFVDVDSIAVGRGDRTRLLTEADTFAVVGDKFDLGVGITFGHGFACCGEEADVEVGSTVLGVGDLVHRGTRILKHDDGVAAQGLSAGYVVAVSFNEPLRTLQGLRPALADARAGLGTAAAK